MKNGICLLCFGDKSFGQLTYNLVASIKQYSDIHVTVFTDHVSIDSVDKTIFDNILDIPSETFYLDNISQPNRFKLCLYDVSPYENTMYIDVDSLYVSNQPINNLFDKLNETVDIIGQNERSIDMTNTTNIFHDVDITSFDPKFTFKKKLVHQLHGQFLLYKRNKETKDFFEISKFIYDEMFYGRIKANFEWKWFGRPIEELTMTLATALCNIKIFNNFAPVSVQCDNLDYNEIVENKWFISICGSSTKELASKNGGYCQNEEFSKKYISYYNNRIKDITKYNCFDYIEKIYKL